MMARLRDSIVTVLTGDYRDVHSEDPETTRISAMYPFTKNKDSTSGSSSTLLCQPPESGVKSIATFGPRYRTKTQLVPPGK